VHCVTIAEKICLYGKTEEHLADH